MMKITRPLFVLVLLVAAGALAGRSNLWYRYANVPLPPDAVEASSEFPPGSNIDYAAANLLDDDRVTAWFSSREDLTPSITFEFDEPVVLQAMRVVNGWARDGDNWRANSRVRDYALVFSDGTVVEGTLPDDDLENTFQFSETVYPEDRPTDWVRLEVRSSYPGEKFAEIGMSEVFFLGRRHRPDAVLFEDLAECTVTFRSEVTIPGNGRAGRADRRSQPVIYLFDQGDHYEYRTYSIRAHVVPPSTAPNDRVVREGRSFEVVNVISHTDEALELACADDTKIVLETQEYGSPRGPFGELNMVEMNELFEGILEFSDWSARTVSDY